MLKTETIVSITQDTQAFWEEQLADHKIADQAVGKEIGHRFANPAEEMTVKFLAGRYTVRHQLSKKKGGRTRSSGDLWVYEEGVVASTP